MFSSKYAIFGFIAMATMDVVVVNRALGQTCTLDELQKLKPAIPQTGGNFGSDVSVSSSFLVVGSSNATVSLSGQGQVFVFERSADTWVPKADLVAADPTAAAHFGTVVALSNTTIAVGAPGDDAAAADSGAVYIFDRLSGFWWQTAKIVPSSVGNSSLAGQTLDLDGDRLIIGGASRFWIYQRNGLSWVENFTSTGNGRSVAIVGDSVFWGSPSDNQQAGSVSWWKVSGGFWVFAGKLPTVGLLSQDYFFGWSIAVDGSRLVVGAPNAVPPQSPTGNRTGAAYTYVFDGQSWNFQSALKASDGQAWDYFGDIVAIQGDQIAVGAKWSDSPSTNSGSGYVYRFGTGWQQTQKFTQSDPQLNSEGFSSIDIFDAFLVAGSPRQDDVPLSSVGAVYSGASNPLHFFKPYGIGCSGSGGFIPQLSMTGCPAPSGAVSLGISNGLGGSLAIVLFSFSQSSFAIPNGCTLLVDPALPPTLTLPLFGSGSGAGLISVTSAFPPSLSGYSFSMQAFTADPANSWGYAATNGLTATVPP